MGNVEKVFDDMITALCDLHHGDVKRIAGGGLLIGRNSPTHDGLFGEGYKHEIYPALDERSICDLESLIGRRIPQDLASFYRKANGISLFCGSLSIGGMRLDYSRSADVFLPVSLRNGNVVDLPEALPETSDSVRNQIRFGFYADGEGRELVAWSDGNPEIMLMPRYQAYPVIYSWHTFADFLRSEMERLVAEYKFLNGNINPIKVLSSPA